MRNGGDKKYRRSGGPRSGGWRASGALGVSVPRRFAAPSGCSRGRVFVPQRGRRHNRREWVRIGEHAVSFLEAGQSFVFDSCSTALEALDASDRIRVHVV